MTSILPRHMNEIHIRYGFPCSPSSPHLDHHLVVIIAQGRVHAIGQLPFFGAIPELLLALNLLHSEYHYLLGLL